MNQVTRTGIVYDTVVLCTVSYALSGWGGYIRQALNDSIDASFWKAGRCHLTCTQYNVNDLLFGVDSKHFACCKSELYSLHHMLPLHSCSSQMTLCPHEAILMIYLEWYMIWESVPLFCCLCINRNQCYCSLCGQLLLSENFPINNCLLWTYCVITALWQRKKTILPLSHEELTTTTNTSRVFYSYSWWSQQWTLRISGERFSLHRPDVPADAEQTESKHWAQ